MKKMILAAAAVVSLGVGTAFAQGVPGGTVPQTYGSQAFANQPYHTGTVFSEIFNHLKGGQANRTAEGNAASAKGG